MSLQKIDGAELKYYTPTNLQDGRLRNPKQDYERLEGTDGSNL